MGEASASRQETSVQHSNPSQHPFPVPFPFCLDDTLARAYARARDARAGGVPTAGDIFAAYSARADEHADERTPDPRTVIERIDVGELLRVFREPIEWVLTRAERRAQADPVDVAAIHRVRDAVRVRVASAVSDTSAVSGTSAPTATAMDGSRIRATDLMIVASALVGTIDPAFAKRAALSVGEGLADAIATMLQLDPSLASTLANAAASFGRPRVPCPVVRPWHCPHSHSVL
jgi:hypothetical protein